MAQYIPAQGDVVWLDFDPQLGKEQAGHRPALVLSATIYNKKIGLMICCPITSQVKGYPFEVELKGIKNVTGVVLSDQLKSLDWRERNATKKGSVSLKILKEVMAKANALLPK